MRIFDFDSDPLLLERFVGFPEQLYSGDPNWIRDPGEARWLSAVALRKLLAVDAEEAVCGRAAVMLNPALRDEQGRPYAQIGFFECVDDLAVAARLVAAALGWLRAHPAGAQTVLAPINFDTWHAYRARTRGFDQPTLVMEPYNPAYYPDLLAGLGFAPTACYVTKTVNDPSRLAAAWRPYHERAVAMGYTFRAFEPAAKAEELGLIYRLSIEIFRENLFFAEIPEAEFRALYAPVIAAIDADLLTFALDPAGQPVGFTFVIPDRQPATANFKTLGVLPRETGLGTGAALAYEAYRRLQERGFTQVNHCLMRAGNRADQFDRGLAEVTREYALYARPLRS